MTRDERRDGTSGSSEPSGELALALDDTVVQAIPPVLTALAAVYLVLVPTHYLFLPAPVAIPMTALAAATALLLGGGRLALRRWAIPPGFGHAVGTLIAMVALTNTLVHMQLVAEPRQTTNLLLIMLGVGLFFVDASWFAIVATVAFGGWLFISRGHLPDPEWVHFGFALFMATVLSAVVMVVRSRNLRGLEELRLTERVRQLELESALAQTERARRGEEEARKSAEAAIHEVQASEGRFRRLANATFEGVIFYRNGLVMDANHRAAELFGMAVEGLIGAQVGSLLASEGPETNALLHTGDDPDTAPETRTVEVEMRRRDGTTFPVAVTSLESVSRGEPVRVLVIRDITRQKKAEELLRRALAEAEATSRAKSSFLTNMSHELRTPLNSVIGFANILQKRIGDDLDAREADYLRRIVSNGEHLLSLIEDILDLSKIDAQRIEMVREPVHLDELADEVMSTLDLQARRGGLALRAQIEPELPPIVADRRRLKQVLLNLVGNAVKFTSSGEVVLRVEAGGDPRRPVRIHVQDTGIGIPEHRLEEIFDPFQQVEHSEARSYGGSGLGLTISRALCELMQFDLQVQSREGRGSTFTIGLASSHFARPMPPTHEGDPPGRTEMLVPKRGNPPRESEG